MTRRGSTKSLLSHMTISTQRLKTCKGAAGLSFETDQGRTQFVPSRVVLPPETELKVKQSTPRRPQMANAASRYKLICLRRQYAGSFRGLMHLWDDPGQSGPFDALPRLKHLGFSAN